LANLLLRGWIRNNGVAFGDQPPTFVENVNRIPLMSYFKSIPVALSLLLFSTLAVAAPKPTPPAPKPDGRLYELRIYYPTPGKYAEIVDRFRQYTTKLFTKHGMTNVGYWTPTDTARKELMYVLSFPDKAAREASWKAFGNDPDWKAVVAKTEANGKLIDHIDSILLTEADFTPTLSISREKPMRTFQLRTYTTFPGKFDVLLTRFRDHTTKLFAKHGMTNIAYFITDEKYKDVETGADAQPKLIYIMAHPSEAEGRQQFKNFGADPAWMQVRDASEVNGKLNRKVESVYMTPTDYSPMQ
jgi:hypothetical protein